MYGHGKKNAMLKKAKVDWQFTTAEARIKLKKNSTHQSKLDRALDTFGEPHGPSKLFPWCEKSLSLRMTSKFQG